MTDKPGAPKKSSKKGQFTKGDPRTKLGGRPKKSIKWEKAEDLLRETLPDVMFMRQNELKQKLMDNPPMALVLTAKYLTESPAKVIERFLGKMAQPLTGADGAPLIPAVPVPILPPIDFSHPAWTPERIDRFIDATAAAAAAHRPDDRPKS